MYIYISIYKSFIFLILYFFLKQTSRNNILKDIVRKSLRCTVEEYYITIFMRGKKKHKLQQYIVIDIS